MAKKIKFALVMADGYKARTLEDLRKHFNLEKLTGYFLDGKLQEWLTDRYYDTEAETLQGLDKTAADFPRNLCAALGVTYEESEEDMIDLVAVARLNEKRAYLQQQTNDADILMHVPQTALTQEDLADLLDDGVRELYLCGDVFTIPMRMGQCRYIGILGEPKVQIAAQSLEELADKGIVLEHVLLPEKLREKKPQTTPPDNKIENHKIRQSYQVSKLLDHRMSDKDREAASKMYDAVQEILYPLVFDIDAGTKPLLQAAQKIMIGISFDIDAGSRSLEDAARSIDLPGAWRTYLSRMV